MDNFASHSFDTWCKSQSQTKLYQVSEINFRSVRWNYDLCSKWQQQGAESGTCKTEIKGMTTFVTLQTLMTHFHWTNSQSHFMVIV